MIETTAPVATPQDLGDLSEAALLEGIRGVMSELHERRGATWDPTADRKAELGALDAELERWWKALRVRRSDGRRTPGVRRRQG